MIIRPAAPNDLADLTGIYNHYVETSHATFDTEPFDTTARAPWFEQFDGARYQCWVAQENGTGTDLGTGIIGFATSQPLKTKRAYETSVEVSVYVAPGHARRGIGRALYQSLLTALDNEDLHRAYGVIALPNDASIALHREFEFLEVARLNEVGRKFDRYWDVIWMERAF